MRDGLTGHLAAHLRRAGAGDYVALLAFVPMTAEHEAVLTRMRDDRARPPARGHVRRLRPALPALDGPGLQGRPAHGRVPADHVRRRRGPAGARAPLHVRRDQGRAGARRLDRARGARQPRAARAPRARRGRRAAHARGRRRRGVCDHGRGRKEQAHAARNGGPRAHGRQHGPARHARRPRGRRVRPRPGRRRRAGRRGRRAARSRSPTWSRSSRRRARSGSWCRPALPPRAPSPTSHSASSPATSSIDGGNSFYKDDVRRAKELAARGIHYVDVGHQRRRLGRSSAATA